MRFAVEEGDHITYINVYNAFLSKNKNPPWCSSNFLDYKALQRASNIRKQLQRFLKRHGVQMESSEQDTISLRKCLVAGFFSHAARLLPDGSYRSLLGNAV
jgi:ATP-dependent RNA helicase DDX35